MSRELAETNKILLIQVGSHLYGTNTPTSDLDFSGLFIAPERYYLGLDKIEEIDLSVVSKLESGKNDSDAVDIKLYELRKYMKLAMENNPNIIEQLFAPDEKIEYVNEFGREILNHRHLFPWRGLKQKFCGYAFSQKHKMTIKTDNYTNLHLFSAWLDENMRNPREETCSTPDDIFANQLLAELRTKNVAGVKFHEHHALVGDINISLTDKLSKVNAKVKERLSKVGNREELYTKYGYDTKFGMHLVRLMLEGRELLSTGNLEYPLKDREMLLDIRNGGWAREDIISYSEELEKEIESLEPTSILPSRPRYDEIEKLLIRMVKAFWNGEPAHE
jgi:uncharacterized protein